MAATDFEDILTDKAIKPKEKTIALSKWVLTHARKLDELLAFAGTAKDPVKATCIEAIEFATKEKPGIANVQCFDFMIASLSSKANRVKWESAKVIGNVAHLFPARLEKAATALLVNTEDDGTVVRWSAAFALGEILKLNTSLNKKLLPAIEAIVKREEKNSIRKIYIAAVNTLKKNRD